LHRLFDFRLYVTLPFRSLAWIFEVKTLDLEDWEAKLRTHTSLSTAEKIFYVTIMLSSCEAL